MKKTKLKWRVDEKGVDFLVHLKLEIHLFQFESIQKKTL